MATRSLDVRASGKTGGRETAEEESAKLDAPAEVQIPVERERTFRRPGFSRFRTDWATDDRAIMQRVHHVIELQIAQSFRDAYAVMFEIYSIVREPVMDSSGEQPMTDRHGFPVWQRSESGAYIEDFTKLTSRQKENLLFSITTKLFDWEQRAAEVWTDAMFAKAMFEEVFAHAFDEPVAGTVEDRRARANKVAAEDRYFAILQSAASRKADAIVRTMTLLSQRLKDSLTA